MRRVGAVRSGGFCCRNARSAAERLGFRYVDRFLQYLIVHGRNRDMDWHALTDRDWPAVRRNLGA